MRGGKSGRASSEKEGQASLVGLADTDADKTIVEEAKRLTLVILL